MDSRIGGARWPLCPLVIVLSSFPSYFFSSASPRAASRRSLKLRFSVRGLRFTAFRENRSPQAKIAGCAASEIFSYGVGTRRQMRMYAQIFSSAREKLKESPMESENSLRARPLTVGFRLGQRRRMRDARETRFPAGSCLFVFGVGQARRAHFGQDHGGRRGFCDRRGDLPRPPRGLRKTPRTIAGAGARRNQSITPPRFLRRLWRFREPARNTQDLLRAVA